MNSKTVSRTEFYHLPVGARLRNIASGKTIEIISQEPELKGSGEVFRNARRVVVLGTLKEELITWSGLWEKIS